MLPSSSKLNEVQNKLAELRDSPMAIVPDEVLRLICNYLIGPSKKSQIASQCPQPFEHWFCAKADQLTVDAAVFLIRLHAYQNSFVDLWKFQLTKVLSGCCDCVRGLKEAEVMSRHTYFATFNDEILRPFYRNFHDDRLKAILDALAISHITPDPMPNSGQTLLDAPSAVVFHIFSDLHMMRDTRIIKIIHSYLPKDPITSWPKDYPPVGLLLLLVDQAEEVRYWAQKQASFYKVAPVPMEHFLPMHVTVLEVVTNAVTGGLQASGGDLKVLEGQIAKDPAALWSGYCVILRFVPLELFRPSKSFNFDIRHVILGHLHDTGNHFIDVLKSFIVMLRRIGPDTWEGEGPEYPHVVFNSIKDNTRYAEMLQGRQNVHKDDWYLKWIDIYVQTIGNLPVFKDILPSVLQFLCEELQHERFKEVRPTAMIVASRLLSAILLHVEKDVPSKHEGLALDVMTIHASTFVSIAFGKAFANDEWAEARTQTRKLIKQALLTDVKCTLSLASQLCSSTDKSSQLSSPIVHEQIWKNVYHEIQPGDSDGVAMLVSTLAKISHMDDFKELAFVDNFRNSHPSHQSALAGVNKALAVFRSGFLDAVARYSDLSLPSIVADLLRRADVVKHITMLMLSPVEMIQETAQALAGSAFDVEVRLDCFRALLDNYPDATLGGIMEFLQSYTQYSVVVPEACSLSQALARCLTDVIEVLCSSPSGLLLHEEFLRAHGESLAVLLPQWWRLMTKALSVIFSKTPRWAVFFDNEDMVLWMRDALIFGRDMLAQRRVIESGALVLSQRQAGPGMKLSRAGRKMVDDLQQVLLELARWLRLTDEELLHQSFALLESLLSCFKETNVRPSPAALQKLQKHVDDGRKKGPGHLLTRLDSTRRAKLEDALNAFDEDEDVQIISHVVPRLKKTAQIPAPKHASSSTLAQIRTPLEKPNQQAPVPLRKSSTKASISNYFTAHDQKKLNAESSLPQFTRQATRVEEKRSAASSTRPTKNLKTVIKDESSSTSRRSVGTSSSSEDEESEEDGDAKGLASLSKLQRTPTIKKPAQRRQVKMLIDAPMGGRNRTIELRNKREDARRTQLRMKPDISGLHRTLLSWDYDYAGPYPPGDKLQLIRVPDRFVDHEQYQKIFEPLLFLECWTQLGESKEETLETYDCQITSRQFTNDYLDVDVSIAGSLQKDWSLSDVDVVLFRHPTSNRGALGKVQSYRTTPVAIQATVRFYLKGSDPGLQINTSWRVSKVLSLATLHREYAALMALPHYDLCNTILQPKITRPEVLDVSEIQQTMRGYNVNEPQARAILGSLGADGFALIQGPPGTGKTSTICGLVHLFLSRRPRSATAIHAGRTGGPADKEPVKKVLLCAPSNAAIDEIAYRLKEGVSGSGRRTIHPKVVRVGAVRSMNVSVRDVSLEYLIDQKLDANPELRGSSGEAGTAIARLRAELESVKRLRQQKLEEISMIHDNSAKTFALEEEVKKLNKQRVNLTHQLDKMKDKQKSDSRTLDATRRKFRAEVLQEADVICSTLSGSAYEYLETYDFEMVIIDEAAQAIELSSLIPLKYGCKTCVMVGDPQQLPPTVKSLDACKFGYDQSLFVRFQRTNPDAVHLLSIQYRMHPDISQLPSNLFYDGRLRDGPDMASKTKQLWHSHTKLGTYRFFNVQSGREENGQGAGHSLVNRVECQVAVALYNRLRQDFSSSDLDFKVGIISMYRGQIGELRRAFERRFGGDITNTVDFNTVDGFQGQEKDIIILSCVRAGPGLQTVGFLRDVRRMNVALTRAKSSLFVLGHAPTLERSDDMWRKIVNDARTRSRLIEADVSYFTAPNPPAKAPLLPSKPPKPSPKNVPPVPPDLMLPRELKSFINRAPAPNVGGLVNAALRDNVTARALPGPPNIHEEPRVGHKRPASDDESQKLALRPNVEPEGTASDKPRLKPPLAKRPKKAPSLFIPKQKRPAPDAGEGGPANSRRRI